MAETTYEIEFNGYIREPNIKTLPKYDGVYCVYECTHNVKAGTVSLHQLIYIGKADGENGIRGRIQGHEKWNDWKKYVSKGNELCFSYANVDQSYNERVEAAYINANQPPENVEYKKSFPFDKTHIKGEGKLKFLKKTFTVDRH